VTPIGLHEPCIDDVCSTHVLKRDATGAFSVVGRQLYMSAINDNGMLAGCMLPDPTAPELRRVAEAAIMHPDGSVDVLPHPPGENASCITRITNGGTVLVQSWQVDGAESQYVVMNGQTFPVTIATPELGAPVTSMSINDLNDQGELAGTFNTYCSLADRAFRHDVLTQATALLEPATGDPLSYGSAIDEQGNVLGYSYVDHGQQRIGAWNSDGEFATLFSAQFPATSPQLDWNEDGLVVASRSDDGRTYVIAEPGVRFELSTLLADGAAPPALNVFDMNERGDFLGDSRQNGKRYLLRRLEDEPVTPVR